MEANSDAVLDLMILRSVTGDLWLNWMSEHSTGYDDLRVSYIATTPDSRPAKRM